MFFDVSAQIIRKSKNNIKIVQLKANMFMNITTMRSENWSGSETGQKNFGFPNFRYFFDICFLFGPRIYYILSKKLPALRYLERYLDVI